MKIKVIMGFLGIVLFAASCGNSDQLSNESLAGSWDVAQIENKILPDTVVFPPGSVVYTFTAGGEFTATSILDTITGDYTIHHGDGLALEGPGGLLIAEFEVTSFSPSVMVWETDTMKATLNIQ